MLLLPYCASAGKLPKWKKGQLDIHIINAGRGECCFYILPDGSTMVVDAGEYVDYVAKQGNVAPKPDAATRPYMVYADYIRHFLPRQSRDSLDWFVLTHYHMDHMGRAEASMATDPEGGYVLGGVNALYSEVPFRTLLDRSYPDYSEAVHTGGTAKDLEFYSRFVEYNVRHRGLKAERFEVGTDRQITPRHGGSWSIFNYAANGRVWDGSKVQDLEVDRENGLSCAFLLSYGDFDWWASGDSNYDSVVNITAPAVGKRVDAQKCAHHMSNPGTVLLEAREMTPQVILTTSFYTRTDQPRQSIIRELAPVCDLYFTNIDESILATDPELYAQCKGINGHIVIRVSRGGKSFRVYMLEDRDGSYRIKYRSKKYRSK